MAKKTQLTHFSKFILVLTLVVFGLGCRGSLLPANPRQDDANSLVAGTAVSEPVEVTPVEATLQSTLTPETPPVGPPPTAWATEAPLESAPTELGQAGQAAVEPAGPLALLYVNPRRIIPASLDPGNQPTEISALFKRIMVEGAAEAMSWYGAPDPAGGQHNFSLILYLDETTHNKGAQGQQNKIVTRNPVRIAINPGETSAQAMNRIFPNGGGGGGMYKNFPTLPLQPGSVEIQPDDPSPVELSSGEEPTLNYNFKFTCQQPGAYVVNIQIPYTTSNGSASEELSLTYPITLACPESVKDWIWDGNSLQAAGNWILQNGQYIAQP